VDVWAPLVAITVGVLLVALAVWLVRHRRDLGSSTDRATFQTLHTVSLASRQLRLGLNETSAERAIRHLRALLGAPAVALTDTVGLLAWDGGGAQHHPQVMTLAEPVLADGATEVYGHGTVRCDRIDCPLEAAVAAPLSIDDRVVGALVVFTPSTSAGLVRATSEVARWVSSQLDLAELDKSRTALMESEVRALRTQISPHFIYNSLTAIASFVRTDPERARELLLEFADFTRYSFRRHGDFTTLAEELRSIERYLLLERARFGDRLNVILQVAPEVLPVAVPFLCLQPLVENAVRHGIEGKAEAGTITIVAEDNGAEACISVEDDGVGMDPERLRRMFAGDAADDSGTAPGIGLSNVDERLRQVYGDEYGLIVETAVGAGTKVSLRVPKYKAGVSAS
jgi:two-component system LytT family sensor kinase